MIKYILQFTMTAQSPDYDEIISVLVKRGDGELNVIYLTSPALKYRK